MPWIFTKDHWTWMSHEGNPLNHETLNGDFIVYMDLPEVQWAWHMVTFDFNTNFIASAARSGEWNSIKVQLLFSTVTLCLSEAFFPWKPASKRASSTASSKSWSLKRERLMVNYGKGYGNTHIFYTSWYLESRQRIKPRMSWI